MNPLVADSQEIDPRLCPECRHLIPWHFVLCPLRDEDKTNE